MGTAMKKSIFKKLLILGIGATMLLSGCAKNPEKLKLGVMTNLDSIPFFVAKEKGFLGENVELELFKSAADRDSALFSKNIDGSTSDLLSVMMAKENDFDGVLTSKTNGYFVMVAGKDSGVTEISQMQGKSIGISSNTIIEYITDTILGEAGVEAEKTAVPLIPLRLEMLVNNKLDGATLPEPFGTIAVASGAVELKIDTETSAGIVLLSKDSIDKKKAYVKELYEAYDKAVDYINSASYEELKPILIEQMGFPEVEFALPVYEKKTMPTEDDVKKANAWLLDKGLVTKEYSLSDISAEVK